MTSEWTNTAIKPNMMSWAHLSQWRLDLDNIIVYYNEIMTGLDHYPTFSNYKTVRYTLVPHSFMSSNSILDIYAIHSYCLRKGLLHRFVPRYSCQPLLLYSIPVFNTLKSVNALFQNWYYIRSFC